MLAPALVAEVQRLLADGKHSQRAVARLTRISRGTVGAIASGRRRDYEVLADADGEEEPVGPPQRCPECGGLVYMPCRLCRVRGMRANHPQPRQELRIAEAGERPRLELRAEHAIRYEEVRAWRRQAMADAATTPMRSRRTSTTPRRSGEPSQNNLQNCHSDAAKNLQ